MCFVLFFFYLNFIFSHFGKLTIANGCKKNRL
jgi:hypothetical protein